MKHLRLDPRALALGILLGVLAALGLGQQAGRSQDIGRYQMTGARGGLFILDTATGELWRRDNQTLWLYGSAAEPTYRSYEVPDR